MRRRVLKAAAIGTASLMMIAPIRTIASDTAAETEAGEKPGFAFETPLTAGEPVELTVSTQWDLSADADESDREGFRILDESLLKVLLEVKDSTSLIADASWIYQEKEALRAESTGEENKTNDTRERGKRKTHSDAEGGEQSSHQYNI